MQRSARARDRRAALYLEDQDEFLDLLRSDLEALCLEANQKSQIPAVRLNGTSDLPWERLHGDLFVEYPEIRFYDYTKIRPRMWHFINGHTGEKRWPENYHLTFSVSERNDLDALSFLKSGGNVAIVFDDRLPKKFWGHSVVDGDKHDARFLDPEGVIVGLRAKGVAKFDASGFVKRRSCFSNAA